MKQLFESMLDMDSGKLEKVAKDRLEEICVYLASLTLAVPKKYKSKPAAHVDARGQKLSEGDWVYVVYDDLYKTELGSPYVVRIDKLTSANYIQFFKPAVTYNKKSSRDFGKVVRSSVPCEVVIKLDSLDDVVRPSDIEYVKRQLI